jgi:hypothetical protein
MFLCTSTFIPLDKNWNANRSELNGSIRSSNLTYSWYLFTCNSDFLHSLPSIRTLPPLCKVCYVYSHDLSYLLMTITLTNTIQSPPWCILQSGGKVRSRQISGWSKTAKPWQLQQLRKWHSVSSWNGVGNSNRRNPVHAEGEQPDRRGRGQDCRCRRCSEKRVRVAAASLGGGGGDTDQAGDLEETSGNAKVFRTKRTSPDVKHLWGKLEE